MVFAPMRPSFRRSPRLAVPTKMDAKTSGTTIIQMRRMKMSPIGLIASARGPRMSPTGMPTRSPMRIFVWSFVLINDLKMFIVPPARPRIALKSIYCKPKMILVQTSFQTVRGGRFPSALADRMRGGARVRVPFGARGSRLRVGRGRLRAPPADHGGEPDRLAGRTRRSRDRRHGEGAAPPVRAAGASRRGVRGPSAPDRRAARRYRSRTSSRS